MTPDRPDQAERVHPPSPAVAIVERAKESNAKAQQQN